MQTLSPTQTCGIRNTSGQAQQFALFQILRGDPDVCSILRIAVRAQKMRTQDLFQEFEYNFHFSPLQPEGTELCLDYALTVSSPIVFAKRSS